MFNSEITVENQSHLFRYSGLIDSLKDTVSHLSNKDVSIELTNKLSQDYSLLRNKLYKNYNDAGKQEIDSWCPAINNDNKDIYFLFYCVTQLSKLTELIHQTGDFLLSQEVKVANAKEVASQIGLEVEKPTPKPSVLHFGMLY
jgi:hypothetical protein